MPALDEAQDINRHLKPLRRQLDDIEQEELPDTINLIAPLLHTIGMIWGNSKHYCKPARIVVLLQEIGNMFIEMVRKL